MIVRSYDQRNTSDSCAAYAALISSISERDRARNVEQCDDILRSFINETNKYEGRFKKTLAVKKLTLESLLNYRFRGTTLPHEELLIALENIIIDNVTTHSAPKVEKIDASATMDIGMAGTDGEEAFEDLYGKAPEFAVQALYKGTGKGRWNGGKAPSWSVQKYFNSGKGEKRSESCWKGTVVQDLRQERRKRARERWQG